MERAPVLTKLLWRARATSVKEATDLSSNNERLSSKNRVKVYSELERFQQKVAKGDNVWWGAVGGGLEVGLGIVSF